MGVGRPVKPPAWFGPAALLCQLAPKFWTPIPQLMGVKIAQRNTLMAKNRPCSASIAHSQGARARAVSGPSGWPLAFGLRDEHRAHPEECNRADWHSTLRYAAAAKRRWKREIVRLPTLRKRIGTAFGTARLVEFALSADDALLFRSVGQILDWGMYARRR